jgi:hypothetical protein
MTRPRTSLTLLVAVLGLVGACARTGGTNAVGDSALGAGVAVAVGQDCDSAGTPRATAPALQPLPADSVIVSATRCVFEPRAVPGNGEWMFRLEQRASGDFTRLAAALRQRSEERTDALCDLIGYSPIIITVTDRKGRQINPELPHTACGAPQNAVVDAINALTWTTFATTKVHQTRSQLEVDSNCAGRWKPVIALEAADAVPGSTRRLVQLHMDYAPLRVCRYALDTDPSYVLSVPGSGSLYGGRLNGASTLDGVKARAFLTAVAAAPPVEGACTRAQAPFADAWPIAKGGPHITIELGGCFRALIDGENYLRQLDAATVARVLG